MCCGGRRQGLFTSGQVKGKAKVRRLESSAAIVNTLHMQMRQGELPSLF